jgi:cyclopropane fatty-acyl-phospholipid synthase-like methyltransferase
LELCTSAAAERNKQPILQEILPLLGADSRVLEVASGSGQHVVHFAAAMPGVFWQPTDRTGDDLASIDARHAATGLRNIAPAMHLDVLISPWNIPADFDALLCINMIHISPWETTPALFDLAQHHLAAGKGKLVMLYGPYKENGLHSAPSNAAFDQWLKAKDARFGVRDLEAVDAVATTCGFARTRLVRMPANNLLLAYRRA